MEKKRKARRRSQLTVIAIVIAALIGVLVVNTDRATADRTTASAQTTVTNGSAAETTTGDETGFYSSAAPSLFKLISALALVIACIYAGVFLLRRLMGKRYSGNRQNSLLEVLETTYLGPKKTVSLVRVADRAVLIGSSENQISPLAELSPEETAKILAAVQAESHPESFQKTFKSALSRMKELGFKKAGKTALET